MKVKEFSIIQYGPLPNTGRISLGNFNLFWGKNEEGKTLTIDALVKLLLGRNIRDFEDNINRVEDDPEGYVILEDDEGKDVKLSERGNLTKVAELTPSECRNIFIIRNSDLSIANESKFYTNITDRLTGLRTEEISKIKENLQEMGKITPGGEFSDVKDEKLRTRINNAKNLIEKIDSLNKKIKEEELDKLEETSVGLREKIGLLTQKLESFEEARKREQYEKGKASWEELQEALKGIKNMEIYNDTDEQLWRDCEKDIKDKSKENEDLFLELSDVGKTFQEVGKGLNEKEKIFQIFNGRKKKVDDELKLELKDYQTKYEKQLQREEQNKIFTPLKIIFSILWGISLLVAILRPSLFILPILFLILTLGFWLFDILWVRRGRTQLARKRGTITMTAAKFELESKNIEGIFSKIQSFNEEYDKKQRELEELRIKKGGIEGKIKEIREKRIPEIERKIEEAQDKINKIKGKSKEETLAEYSNKLASKQKYEKSAENQKSILENLFKKRGEKLEENISFWQEEIDMLKGYQDKAKKVEYKEKEVSKLKEEKTLLEKSLIDLNDKMSHFRKNLEEIEREANEILKPEDFLPCDTLVDLAAIKEKVQYFLNENESNKEAVLEIKRIFEKIEMEEKEKVGELFAGDGSIAMHFSEITGGLYEGVSLDQEGKIKVQRKGGVTLEAEKLSGGAYDQLYLCIRLALGEKLLKGKKGFFILDDPFIKADPDRLNRQMMMLKKISALGWQVMYFSAKGEVRDSLMKDIKNGNVNYIEIPGITGSGSAINPQSTIFDRQSKLIF